MSKKQKRKKLAVSILAGLLAVLMLLPMLLSALDMLL